MSKLEREDEIRWYEWQYKTPGKDSPQQSSQVRNDLLLPFSSVVSRKVLFAWSSLTIVGPSSVGKTAHQCFNSDYRDRTFPGTLLLPFLNGRHDCSVEIKYFMFSLPNEVLLIVQTSLMPPAEAPCYKRTLETGRRSLFVQHWINAHAGQRQGADCV